MGIKLHFLNVGHGESTLIEVPDGQLMVVDLNRSDDLDDETAAEVAGELHLSFENLRRAHAAGVSYLAQMRESYVVALDDPLAEIADIVGEDGRILRYAQTHPDLDHMRGIGGLLEHHEVQNFWDTDHANIARADFESDSDKNDWQAYEKRRKNRLCYYRGKHISPDGTQYTIHVFHPTPDALAAGDKRENPDTNGFSYVLLVECDQLRALLTGDVTCAWWKDLYDWVAATPWAKALLSSIDVLQAAHHGRESGLCGWIENGQYSREFLDLMDPDLVVVSVGTRPDTDKRNWYRKRPDGTQRSVWSTRWRGTIWVEGEPGQAPVFSTRFASGKPSKELATIGSLGLPVAYEPRKFKICAWVSKTKDDEPTQPYSPGSRPLPKNRSLRFRLQTDIPEPYDVHWRVRNSGEEARAAGGLRGELEPDDGSKSKRETTLYRGTHSMEAVAVKAGRVVAHDLTWVRIK